MKLRLMKMKYCDICKTYLRTGRKLFSILSITYQLSFQTRFPKLDQHIGGKWLIHDTKHSKENQL